MWINKLMRTIVSRTCANDAARNIRTTFWAFNGIRIRDDNVHNRRLRSPPVHLFWKRAKRIHREKSLCIWSKYEMVWCLRCKSLPRRHQQRKNNNNENWHDTRERPSTEKNVCKMFYDLIRDFISQFHSMRERARSLYATNIGERDAEKTTQWQPIAIAQNAKCMHERLNGAALAQQQKPHYCNVVHLEKMIFSPS